jgi:hypothetical protein
MLGSTGNDCGLGEWKGITRDLVCLVWGWCVKGWMIKCDGVVRAGMVCGMLVREK